MGISRLPTWLTHGEHHGHGLGAFLAIKKVHISCIPCVPCIFDVHPPIHFMTSWTTWCIESTHHAVHCTNANIGGSLEGVHRKKMNEPSDDSEVVINSSEVPDQVQAKKQNEVHNKRDATVLEKLKTSSVEDIILDKMKTQILSIAGVDYVSLSAKVQLYFCREMGIMVLNKKRKKEEITELILNHISG